MAQVEVKCGISHMRPIPFWLCAILLSSTGIHFQWTQNEKRHTHNVQLSSISPIHVTIAHHHPNHFTHVPLIGFGVGNVRVRVVFSFFYVFYFFFFGQFNWLCHEIHNAINMLTTEMSAIYFDMIPFFAVPLWISRTPSTTKCTQ